LLPFKLSFLCFFIIYAIFPATKAIESYNYFPLKIGSMLEDVWQPCPWFSEVSCFGNGSNGPSKTKNHKNTPIFWKFVPLTLSKKIHNDVTDTFCAKLFKRARFSLHSLLKTITTIVGRSPNRLFPHISQLHQTIIHTQRIHQRRAALIHFWQCL